MSKERACENIWEKRWNILKFKIKMLEEHAIIALKERHKGSEFVEGRRGAYTIYLHIMQEIERELKDE